MISAKKKLPVVVGTAVGDVGDARRRVDGADVVADAADADADAADAADAEDAVHRRRRRRGAADARRRAAALAQVVDLRSPGHQQPKIMETLGMERKNSVKLGKTRFNIDQNPGMDG